VLSGYIPAKGLIDASFSEANRSTPIFAAHGTFDDVLNVRLGEEAVEFAREHGCTVEWQTYPMPHSVCMEEVEALRAWLAVRLTA
jgi:phospholipase/carboxylesterase